MSEEGAFLQKMTRSYVLSRVDYEDPNRVFPMKEDDRKLMRSCRRCGVLHDINSPAAEECNFHKSFFRLTVPQARVGLVVGRGGRTINEIRERSKVSNLTIPKNERGRFKGEIQVEGGSGEVEHASSLIRQKLMGMGSVDGSWACCKDKMASANGCTKDMNHDSMIQWCFLDKSKVVTTQHSLAPGRVFALDCEMVVTTRGKEVARVTLLDFKGHSCYETLVKPLANIVDYKTAFNGITENILQGVSTTLVDVQNSLLERVSADDLLVGHSIDDDLRCLHLEHRKVMDILC